jgi:hypothetical protein
MGRKGLRGFVCLALCLVCAASAPAQIARHRVIVPAASAAGDRQPTGKGWGEAPKNNAHAGGGHLSGNGISYHGGPLMLGATNVYYIWYGDWSGDTAVQSILLDFASSIGGSAWFNINTTYYNGSGLRVSNAVHYGGSSTDNYSQGTALTDAAVASVVSRAISLGQLPNDLRGVYFVLTAKDVQETSGFCTNYCGWHTHAPVLGSDIKFAFVGNAQAQCPASCEWQTVVSPNGHPAADAMANIVAHELSEAVTDPDLNAWYDVSGYENADKCVWTFGAQQTAANGSLYNVTLGSRQYLLQQNWANARGGYCALKY